MGRKPISDQRKYAVLVIRVTEKERAALDRAAKRDRLPTSTWARDLLLNAAGVKVKQRDD